MHTQIDIAREDRALNLFRENTARANLFDRDGALYVAARRDFDKLDVMPEPSQFAGHPFR
jgi:hypothetical protein